MDANLFIGILTLLSFVLGAILINAETKREERKELEEMQAEQAASAKSATHTA